MAVIALTSAARSPGVTTCAVAMTQSWPRPCMLVEADVSGSSSILAGYLGGQVRHDRGLIDLAVGQRRGNLSESLYPATIPLSQHARLLAGLSSPAQAAMVASVWEPLAIELRALERRGADVIVDAGRLGAHHPPTPLVRASDVVLLVTGSTLPSVAATRARAGGLKDELTANGGGTDSLALLVVGEGRPYPAREIADVIGLPVVATVEWAPDTAEVFSLGAKGGRKVDRSGLVRSIGGVNLAVRDMIRARQARLAPRRMRMEVSADA
jgi:hypothetical protein